MTMNVLVAGATGKQGGAVVDQLLADDGDYHISGLTRSPASDSARALESRGITVLEGDLTDAERMHAVCRDVEAVFCVTTFFEAGTDVETTQGVTLAEAASDAGVERFLFSSVGRAAEAPLDHFQSKARVEERVRELDFDWTILRPVFFMQNFPAFYGDELAKGTLSMPLSGNRPLALLDARDIGKTVGMALADPERFTGETIQLAGDNRTPTEVASALLGALGHEVTHVRPDIDDYRSTAGDEMADMFQWFETTGYGSDPTADATAFEIDPNDFEAFLTEGNPLQVVPSAA